MVILPNGIRDNGGELRRAAEEKLEKRVADRKDKGKTKEELEEELAKEREPCKESRDIARVAAGAAGGK